MTLRTIITKEGIFRINIYHIRINRYPIIKTWEYRYHVPAA